ncbi:NAD(P)/FAD-dependent oxidoreductase [Amycolatopsis samaneae]|uniref:NAD(P)/FAD-dependent oxidoreductase n=1 Tax=Amycolatopsis samaneae TaxID=664691 RepID=A0ABW5GKE6_9PSEU
MNAGPAADVAVIGTGIVGMAVAYRLLRRGHTVTVIGPRPGPAAAGQATSAAGAMLSPFSEVDATQPEQRVALEVEHRLRALARYPAWLEEITATTGIPMPLVPGTWVVATEDERESVAAIARAAHAAGHTAETAAGTHIDGLQPEVPPAVALWLPSEPAIDIARLLTALGAAITRHRRARWVASDAVQVSTGAAPVRIRCTDGSTAESDRVVLAAGTGIPALLGPRATELGVPPVLAGRGVSLLLNAPLSIPYTIRTPNLAFACGSHLVPRGDGTLYLGATNRLTLTPAKGPAATLDEIAVLIDDGTRRLEQRLSAAALHRVQLGHRPYTLDHLPLIGPTRDPAVLVATATYRCGVLLAPLLADLIADVIDTPAALDLHPYRAGRPIATPSATDLFDTAAARGLAQHLLGTTVPSNAASHRQLTALLGHVVPALVQAHGPTSDAVARLFSRAPVVETFPALLALLERLEHPCPAPLPIPRPRSCTPQPSSATAPSAVTTGSANSASTPSTSSPSPPPSNSAPA